MDFELNENKHFSLQSLLEKLNQNCSKKSGAKFTAQDLQGYISRGGLPSYLGGHSLKQVSFNGIQMVEVS